MLFSHRYQNRHVVKKVTVCILALTKTRALTNGFEEIRCLPSRPTSLLALRCCYKFMSRADSEHHFDAVKHCWRPLRCQSMMPTRWTAQVAKTVEKVYRSDGPGRDTTDYRLPHLEWLTRARRGNTFAQRFLSTDITTEVSTTSMNKQSRPCMPSDCQFEFIRGRSYQTEDFTS